jgi:tyrosyl-tRNA synthetase
MKNVLETLKERGLLQDITSPSLYKVVESPITVYAGFDPTSDSLQVGNLAAIIALMHFQRCGHRVIGLIGGATAQIGDPSGKETEREPLSPEQIRKNAEGIYENLARFIELDHPQVPAKILNNADWLEPIGFLQFLRDIGRCFRINVMLAKESVKARLNSQEGMSYTEFSYQLLQAYDFLKLYDTHNCILQIGGSDQWGNITAGIDLIRRLRGVETYGLTLPLICDSSGRKFGKTEGNAIYLDRRKTSYYDFYQFFVRTADNEVIHLLKVYTFLTLEEIKELEEVTKKTPEKRIAQKKLAEEVTRLVHGEEGLKTALKATAVMFGGSMDDLDTSELMAVLADVPSVELPVSRVKGCPVVDVAASAGLCSSKSEARRLINNQGLYLNNRRITSIDYVISSSDIKDGRLVVLRSGKKNFLVVKVIDN